MSAVSELYLTAGVDDLQVRGDFGVDICWQNGKLICDAKDSIRKNYQYH